MLTPIEDYQLALKVEVIKKTWSSHIITAL